MKSYISYNYHCLLIFFFNTKYTSTTAKEPAPRNIWEPNLEIKLSWFFSSSTNMGCNNLSLNLMIIM